ncbi:MAG: chromosomal replication initiator protein DnaA [Clostridia bacterium]|nr:chromosomal replication initiator protein DnaA [Clostridia bacterium]
MAYIDELNLIWQSVKDELKKEMLHSTFELWFGDFKVIDYKDDVIIFSTESEFKLKKAKEKHLVTLEDAFEKFFGFRQSIDVVFTGEMTSDERISRQFGLKIGEFDNRRKRPEPTVEKEPEDEPEEVEAVIGRPINFQYTFDNFIVGASNKFAHAACLAVASNPADNYNPLFIYGPSGLGKTHLMSAVVNEIKRKNPRAKVVYVKGEDFTNEMIESLSEKSMNKFHDKYRKCDVLLIDDIQFIAGKTSTQEEFFHTFNTLHENNSQIVLSSDRPPKDIATLEERLKTRFEWGLIADIQPPDLELRIAIIKKKAEQADVVLSDEVSTFLAENLRSNIRQIEGTVKKLSAIVYLEGRPITMDVAAACLQEFTGGVVPTQVIIDKIFTCVYKKYGFDKKTLIGSSRVKEIAFTRHLTIYLIRELTEMSYPSIAKIFDRNHSTIISSCEAIEKKLSNDPLFLINVSDLKKDIEGLDTV